MPGLNQFDPSGDPFAPISDTTEAGFLPLLRQTELSSSLPLLIYQGEGRDGLDWAVDAPHAAFVTGATVLFQPRFGYGPLSGLYAAPGLQEQTITDLTTLQDPEPSLHYDFPITWGKSDLPVGEWEVTVQLTYDGIGLKYIEPISLTVLPPFGTVPTS